MKALSQRCTRPPTVTGVFCRIAGSRSMRRERQNGWPHGHRLIPANIGSGPACCRWAAPIAFRRQDATGARGFSFFSLARCVGSGFLPGIRSRPPRDFYASNLWLAGRTAFGTVRAENHLPFLDGQFLHFLMETPPRKIRQTFPQTRPASCSPAKRTTCLADDLGQGPCLKNVDLRGVRLDEPSNLLPAVQAKQRQRRFETLLMA
jgi:hypothetical protein